jgi:hypothetical protein
MSVFELLTALAINMISLERADSHHPVVESRTQYAPADYDEENFARFLLKKKTLPEIFSNQSKVLWR